VHLLGVVISTCVMVPQVGDQTHHPVAEHPEQAGVEAVASLKLDAAAGGEGMRKMLRDDKIN
jgi:hypothetical protein